MGERSARSSSNGGTTNLNATGLRRIGFAAMSLACPLMLASLSVANAVAQSPEDRLTGNNPALPHQLAQIILCEDTYFLQGWQPRARC